MENFEQLSRRGFVRTASVGIGDLTLGSFWPFKAAASPDKS